MMQIQNSLLLISIAAGDTAGMRRYAQLLGNEDGKNITSV